MENSGVVLPSSSSGISGCCSEESSELATSRSFLSVGDLAKFGDMLDVGVKVFSPGEVKDGMLVVEIDLDSKSPASTLWLSIDTSPTMSPSMLPNSPSY